MFYVSYYYYYVNHDSIIQTGIKVSLLIRKTDKAINKITDHSIFNTSQQQYIFTAYDLFSLIGIDIIGWWPHYACCLHGFCHDITITLLKWHCLIVIVIAASTNEEEVKEYRIVHHCVCPTSIPPAGPPVMHLSSHHIPFA